MQARSFSKIAEKLPGAEGPVFTPDGNFYMVAPEVEKDGKSAGQILRVDLAVGTVSDSCQHWFQTDCAQLRFVKSNCTFLFAGNCVL